jgi:hypothetical protein
MAERNYRFRLNPATVKGTTWIWDVLTLDGTALGAAYWSEEHWTSAKHRWAVYGQESVETDQFKTRDMVALHLLEGQPPQPPKPRRRRLTVKEDAEPSPLSERRPRSRSRSKTPSAT